MSRPLTAAQLADALGYFSNTVIGAMHHGTATEACIAQGIDAVAGRLEEIGGPPPSPETDPLVEIQELMNGTEWDADTLEDIAAILRKAGYEVNDPEDDDPAYDDQGNLRAGDA